MTSDPDEVACLLSQTCPLRRDDTKVQVRPDRRDLLDLSSAFRHISMDVLARVWESSHESWDVCFDVLSAWLRSHGPELASLAQLEGMLGPEQPWPALPPRDVPLPLLPPMLLPQLTACLAHLALTPASLRDNCSGASDGWSVCEVSDDTENDNESTGCSSEDIGEDWVQVQVEAAPARRSFRDILLTPSPITLSPSPSASSPPSASTNKRPRSDTGGGLEQGRAWRPQVVCVQLQARHRHCDVLYMDSAEMQST